MMAALRKLKNKVLLALCGVGLHIKFDHKRAFWDWVSRKTVYDCRCSCGGKWLADYLGWFSWGSGCSLRTDKSIDEDVYDEPI